MFAQNVVFSVDVDVEKNPGLIFADLSSVSQFTEEQEVLFDISTLFRIEKVTEVMQTHEDYGMLKRIFVSSSYLKITLDASFTWIYMSATDQGGELVKKYITLQRAEMSEFSLVMMFGRLLCFMGEHGKARGHFQHLLDHGKEDKASLYHNIGFVCDREQNYQAALEYYDKARLLLMTSTRRRVEELAVTLNNMAVVHSRVS